MRKTGPCRMPEGSWWYSPTPIRSTGLDAIRNMVRYFVDEKVGLVLRPPELCRFIRITRLEREKGSIGDTTAF